MNRKILYFNFLHINITGISPLPYFEFNSSSKANVKLGDSWKSFSKFLFFFFYSHSV